MKKLTILLLGIVLAYSCSTSTDSNGNSTTVGVPVPPTNLTGSAMSTTKIYLSWTDSSTNETGFKIERKTVTGTFAVVGTTTTDITIFSDTSLTPSTTYIYRVYSYNAAGNSPTYSNERTLTTSNQIVVPTLTTTMASSITSSNALSGGTITSDGGASVIARGVVWGTTVNPTITLSSKTTDGAGTATFVSAVSGLSAVTTYYVRAYATNSYGTAYGNELNFITSATSLPCDDNTTPYPTVTIGNRIWMQKNLNVCKYRNGDDIPQVTDLNSWNGLTTGAWCYYANDTANGLVYGKLYNWYAVNDPRGLAPVGWHIPSDDEWTILTTYLGGIDVAGGKMKATTLWNSPNTATNSSGFTALPGGSCYKTSGFSNLGLKGNWWSSTVDNTNTNGVWSRYINYNLSYVASYAYNKNDGFSVRCVKD